MDKVGENARRAADLAQHWRHGLRQL